MAVFKKINVLKYEFLHLLFNITRCNMAYINKTFQKSKRNSCHLWSQNNTCTHKFNKFYNSRRENKIYATFQTKGKFWITTNTCMRWLLWPVISSIKNVSYKSCRNCSGFSEKTTNLYILTLVCAFHKSWIHNGRRMSDSRKLFPWIYVAYQS